MALCGACCAENSGESAPVLLQESYAVAPSVVAAQTSQFVEEEAPAEAADVARQGGAAPGKDSKAPVPEPVPETPVLEPVPEPVPDSAEGAQPKPQDEPTPQETEWRFRVSVQKSAGGLGMDLSPHDGVTLLVGKVRPGPIQAWNHRCGISAPERIRPGDRIVAVNEVTGDAQNMLSHMRAADPALTLTFIVRRLLDFAVAVATQEGVFGLSVFDTGATLRVNELTKGGAVETANRQHAEELIVMGDEIYEVNEVSGSGKSMLEAFRTASQVTMKVRRAKIEGLADAAPGDALAI